jgi:hypothetical protein
MFKASGGSADSWHILNILQVIPVELNRWACKRNILSTGRTMLHLFGRTTRRFHGRQSPENVTDPHSNSGSHLLPLTFVNPASFLVIKLVSFIKMAKCIKKVGCTQDGGGRLRI